MPQVAQKPLPTYRDNPSISETFADSVRTVLFDGQTVRIELCVTRYEMDSPNPKDHSATRNTSCRLVLSIDGANELFVKLDQSIQALKLNKAVPKGSSPQ